MYIHVHGGPDRQTDRQTHRQADRHLGLLVLDPMCLVDHHVPPVELLEGGLLLQHHLVGGDDHVPLPRHDLLADDAVLGAGQVTVIRQ